MSASVDCNLSFEEERSGVARARWREMSLWCPVDGSVSRGVLLTALGRVFRLVESRIGGLFISNSTETYVEASAPLDDSYIRLHYQFKKTIKIPCIR